MSTAQNTATNNVYVPNRQHNRTGVSNWRMPWHTSGKFAFYPINVTRKKPYRQSDQCPLLRKQRAMNAGNGPRTTSGKNAAPKSAIVKMKRYLGRVLEVRHQFGRNTGRWRRAHGKKFAPAVDTRYSLFKAAQVDGCTPQHDADAPIEQRVESASSSSSGSTHASYIQAIARSTRPNRRNHPAAVCRILYASRLLRHAGRTRRGTGGRGRTVVTANWAVRRTPAPLTS
jgi:hypothetical protein